MQRNGGQRTLGILGGVGPLASSKFLESIYLFHAKRVSAEQALPKIILYSDPSMPDRTKYLEKGMTHILLDPLIEGLSKLLTLNVDDLVICCFTLHHLFNLIPTEIRNKIISLSTVVLKKVMSLQKQSLLLCTRATNKLEVFQNDPNWNDASQYIVIPDNADQIKIHECIYQLKRNDKHTEVIGFITQLLDKYHVDTWIAGCTEFHLINNTLMVNEMSHTPYTVIDSALIIADQLVHYESFGHSTAQIADTV